MDTNILIYPELSYLLTGILSSVHNDLGSYAMEKQYADLFENKIKEQDLRFLMEQSVSKSGNRLDFIVDNKIIIEFKAKRVVKSEDYRQIQHYLQETGSRLGLLVNFRNKYRKPIRVVRIESNNKNSTLVY